MSRAPSRALRVVEEVWVDAPPARVFRALTDPRELVAWWSVPGVYTTTEAETDVRPGGRYRLAGRSEARGSFEVLGTYESVEPPHRLVYRWRPDWDADALESRVEVDLEERDGGTHVRVVHTGFLSERSRDDHAGGWPAVLAALDAHATGGGSSDLTFTVTVPLPPDEAFAMWVTPERARQFLAEEVRIDPRVGGRYETLYDPTGDPAGARQGTYGSRILELDAPRTLRFEWISLTPPAAAEALGGERMLQETAVAVTFEPVGPGATRVRIRHHGFGADPHSLAAAAFYGEQGWPWILRRLEALFPGASK